jgi:hypothetical protein
VHCIYHDKYKAVPPAKIPEPINGFGYVIGTNKCSMRTNTSGAVCTAKIFSHILTRKW